jgi:hypothetical protein
MSYTTEDYDRAIQAAVASGDQRTAMELAAALNSHLTASAPKPAQPAKPAEPQFDPTEGMSSYDKFAAGLGKSVNDLGLMLRQGASMVGFGDKAKVQADIDEAKRLDAPLMNTGWGMAGDLTGQIGASLLPGGALKLAGRGLQAAGAARIGQAATQAGQALIAPQGLKQGAAVGAAMGAMQPVASDETLGDKVALGAAGGAIIPGAASVIKPQLNRAKQMLIDEGVRLTPGQSLGGIFKWAEDAAQNTVPFVGSAINSARGRGIEDYNRALYNRVLRPLGVTYSKAGPVGRDGVEAVGNHLSDAYDTVLGNMSGIPADQTFMQRVFSLRQMADDLTPEFKAKFDKVLQRNVWNEFTPGATNPSLVGPPIMGPETFKKVESKLGEVARQYRGYSATAEERAYSDAIRQLQSELRGMVGRADPANARAIQNINKGWAELSRVEDAASRAGSKEGVITPAQYRAAVTKGDHTARHRGVARGDALGIDIADAGEKILPSKIGDSGTGARMMLGGMAGGLAGLPTLAGLGAASLAYTRPGVALMDAAITRRPQAAGLLADALRKKGAYLTAPSVGLLELSQQ